jgi:hypothetical protein
VLNDDENSVINFSKSETIGAFLENGTKNWNNHGGESKTLFSNLQLNIEGTSFIFSFTVNKSSTDYADYVELQANNNGTINTYSYGNPRDGKQMDSPVNLNYGPSKFKSGTVLTVTVYSSNRESARLTYNV